MEFQPFPKIPRLSRDIVVTEKIDGTNAQIHISDDGKELRAASRGRYISAGDDNFGFAKWVEDNREELLKLGPGRHFGEWWGAGIQRGYGRKDRVFSLFNTALWGDPEARPACCSVVPVLYTGPFHTAEVEACLEFLITTGSLAQPGFMNPEGVIVFHTAAGSLFKKTVKDDAAKGARK